VLEFFRVKAPHETLPLAPGHAVLAGATSVVHAQKARGLDLESGSIFSRLRHGSAQVVEQVIAAVEPKLTPGKELHRSAS
jgi:hypothetical protein